MDTSGNAVVNRALAVIGNWEGIKGERARVRQINSGVDYCDIIITIADKGPYIHDIEKIIDQLKGCGIAAEVIVAENKALRIRLTKLDAHHQCN